MNKAKVFIVSCAALIGALLAGCSSTPKGPDPIAFTEEGLAATTPQKAGVLGKGSSAEREAIEQFEKFNSDYSKANVTNNTKNVYDPRVYFRDPFKEIRGEAEFEAYLLRGADGVDSFSMDWLDVSEHDGNYYFRWIMTVKLKRDGKDAPPTRITGISHVRFGTDGKVIFHQDYFDGADLIYSKVMGLSSGINYVKGKM